MNNPRVSIIVPVYNVELYLRQCMDSLCAQTIRDIEIICVDDCGSDGSLGIVEEYAERDERVRVLRHERNRGLSAARNTGMKEASAPYIMFCDSDDWYEDEMCERMLSVVESTGNIDLALCGVRVHYETLGEQEKNDEVFFRHSYRGVVPVSPAVVRSCDECAWDKIYRRSIIEKHQLRFPEGLKHEDLYFFNTYIVYARCMYFVEEKLYHYRRREGSIMAEILSGKSMDALDTIRVGCSLWEFFNRGECHDRWRYYADWLWKRSIETIVYGPYDEKIYAQAVAMLCDFVQRQGFERDEIPAPILDGLALFYREPRVSRKTLCGLVREKISFMDRKLSVMGISVCNENYDFDSVSIKKYGRKRKLSVSESSFHAFDIDSTTLLDELRELGEFTYIPHQGNLGDALLVSAALQFFDANHLPYRMFCEMEQPSDVIVCGGGSWNLNYEYDGEQFLPLFARAKKVVILPSSFERCPRLVETMDERFVVFCREKRSYNYLISTGCKSKIILDHDMALRLKKSFLNEPTHRPKECYPVHEIMRDFSLLLDNKVGYLLRRDSESTDLPYVPSVDLSNYFFFPPQATKEELYYYGKLLLCAVEYFETIVTDRLHVGIAAALMNKEVYLLDNVSKIISSAYEHSLSNVSHMHMLSELPMDVPPSNKISPNASLIALMRKHHLKVRKNWKSLLMKKICDLCMEANGSPRWAVSSMGVMKELHI